MRVATRTGVVACRPAFERYAALCRDYPPERVARITGVTAAQIVETARLLWERRPVAYFHWTGLEQHTNASQTVRAISLLYALTGSFDAPGGNVRPTRPPVNDLGALSLLPAGQLEKALGRAERPLGIARNGWVLAADVYRPRAEGRHAEPDLQVPTAAFGVERPRRNGHPAYRGRALEFSLVGRSRMRAGTHVMQSRAV